MFLQKTPEHTDPTEVMTEIKSVPGILEIHDLHIWSLDGEYHILTAHLVVEKKLPLEDHVKLKKLVKERLAAQGIQHATLEFEVFGDDCVK